MLPSESHDYGCVGELGNSEMQTFHTNMQIQRQRSARDVIVRRSQITALKCAHIIQHTQKQQLFKKKALYVAKLYVNECTK